LSEILDHVRVHSQYGTGYGWSWEPVPYLQARLFVNVWRFEPQYPVQIEAKGDLGHSGKQYTWKCILNGVNRRDAASSEWSPAPDSPLPLLAFYQAGRWWPAQKTSDAMRAATEKPSRFNAYDDWQEAEISSNALQNWVIAKCLERLQLADETGQRFDDIQDDELALVNNALKQALPEVLGLRHDMRQKTLMVEWSSEHANGDFERDFGKAASSLVSFEHLSDGQRTALCLIADIARRICLLNPQLGRDAMRKTPGLVLIDELDAHLHPKWQRLLTKGLKAAFPAVQFIVTSHSPQVLGELAPEEILLLRPDGAGHPQVSYGLDAAQVLEIIMEAPARNEEVGQEIREIFQLIEDDKLASAKERLDALQAKAPGVPELAGAGALIRRKEILGR
jgi:predicted ATP-binding protein involved in virulence